MFASKNDPKGKKIYPEREKLIKKHKIPNKSPRGSYIVSNDEKSGTNCITVLDSKPISILTTAAGVTPLTPVLRINKEIKKKAPIEFPAAFNIYNKFMGGVDLHDEHCSNLRIHIGGKKWTWHVLCKLIESSLANGLVLYNLVNDKSTSAKDFSLAIAKSYLVLSLHKLRSHLQITIPEKQRRCKLCSSNTHHYCYDCKKHYCNACFENYHGLHSQTWSEPRVCKASNSCNNRTRVYCNNCNKNICNKCFHEYHKLMYKE